MGHANLTNISKTFVNLLCEKGQVSIRDVVTELKRKDEKVMASESDYDDDGMLSYACEQVLSFLLELHGKSDRTPAHKCQPIVKFVSPLTKRQEELLFEFLDENMGHWDPNGEDSDYAVFEGIKWERTEFWSKVRKGAIPLLGYFEN